jgi:hypothetical protein
VTTASPTARTPSVTVRLAAGEETIEFNLRRMCAIEDAMGRSVSELYEEIVRSIPVARNPDGSPRLNEDGRPVPPSPEEVRTAARTLRTSFMASFVGAATGRTIEQVEADVGLAIIPVYGALLGAFCEALIALNGPDGDGVGRTRPTSSGTPERSGPSPVSSSASNETNSSGTTSSSSAD